MSIFNISDWFRRSPNRQSAYQNFFYKVGGGFNYNELSDAKGIESTLCSSAFYSVVRTAAEGVASLPIELKVQRGEEWETVTEGPIHNFIFQPNQEQSLSEYWEELMYYYFINGELFSYQNREAVGFMEGEVVSLPPELMEVITKNQSSILSTIDHYKLNDGATTRNILPEDILHLKMTNPSVQGRKRKNGLSPLQAGQQMLNASINLDTALSWYFENRGASMLASGNGNPTTSMQPKDEKAVDSAFKTRAGGARNVNGVVFTQNPVTLQQLNASSTDMQMIQNYNLVVERLAALIDLPAILVQVNANSTYNNVKEAKSQAYTELYIPTGEKLIKGYSRTYLKEWSEITGESYKLEINHNLIKTLQPDPTEHRKQIREDVRAGILTRNEAREALGKDLIDLDEMNTPTVQNNLVPIQNLDNEASE